MITEQLLRPRSIAVIGASERPGHGSTPILNLQRVGYEGALYAVNPRYETVHGVPCFPDVTSLPEVPDCMIVAIPAAGVADLIEDAAQRGTRGFVVFSAGFSETGAAGAERQQRLYDVCAAHGVAVCGPNGVGLVNANDRIPLYAVRLPSQLSGGNVAVVAQSGSVSTQFVARERLPAGYVVSCGNQAVTDCTDYLEYFAADPAIDVVGFFLEELPRPDRFFEVAEQATMRGKAVVVCRGGRSARGAEASAAHTGALAGSYRTLVGLCEQYGVQVVGDLDELFETATALSRMARVSQKARWRPEGGLAVVGYSGGEVALVLDQAEDIGLTFPEFTEPTRTALREILPPFANISNPLDVTGAVIHDRETYRRCLEAVGADPGIGLISLVHDMPNAKLSDHDRAQFHHMIESASHVSDQGLPVAVMTPLASAVDPDVLQMLDAHDIPVLLGLRNGVRALHSGLAAVRAQRRAPRLEPAPPQPILTRADIGAATTWGEAPSKELLGKWGLPVAIERLVDGTDEAIAAADELGYPVSLKVASDQILHKSDVGGVFLGLRSADEVAAAYDEMRHNVAQRLPDVPTDRAVVQEMVDSRIELIVGMKQEPGIGPVVVFGLGGVFTEALDAVIVRRAPLSPDEVTAAIRAAPWAAVLDNYRNIAADAAAVARLVSSFSEFCAAHADLLDEVDLNPVCVLPDGVKIVDALIRFRGPA